PGQVGRRGRNVRDCLFQCGQSDWLRCARHQLGCGEHGFHFHPGHLRYWLSRYYLDPILLYLNPLPTASGQIKVPLANSPVPYLTLNGPEVIGVKGSYILNFASQGDVATISDPNLGVLNLGPENGTSWTHDLILNSGWSLTSQPANLTIY